MMRCVSGGRGAQALLFNTKFRRYQQAKSLFRSEMEVNLMTKIRCVKGWNKMRRTAVSAEWVDKDNRWVRPEGRGEKRGRD